MCREERKGGGRAKGRSGLSGLSRRGGQSGGVRSPIWHAPKQVRRPLSPLRLLRPLSPLG